MQTYMKKNRANKLKGDRILDDLDDNKTTLDIYAGIVPRLTDLIRWAQYCFWALLAIAFMLALFFLRDAVQVVIGLF